MSTPRNRESGQTLQRVLRRLAHKKIPPISLGERRQRVEVEDRYCWRFFDFVLTDGRILRESPRVPGQTTRDRATFSAASDELQPVNLLFGGPGCSGPGIPRRTTMAIGTGHFSDYEKATIATAGMTPQDFERAVARYILREARPKAGAIA